jgi:hypothetical protein
MKGNGETDTHLLTGEIVGIYEKDNTRIAKVKYDSGFIDIPLNNVNDIHLNDKVIISSSIWIKNIIQKVEEK